jgi:cell division protease FtsH
MLQSQKKLLFWALLILLVIAIYNMFAPTQKPSVDYVPLGQVMTVVRDEPGQIKWLRISGEHWRGEWANGARFHTSAPKLDGALVDQLADVRFEVVEEDRDSWSTLLIGSWLPMLAIVSVFFLFMRQLQKQAKKAGPTMIDLFKRIAELEAEVERLKNG